MANQNIYQQYYPIQSVQLKTDRPLNFDLYIYLPANHKYILYRRKNTVLDEVTVKKFENFKMKTLYTTKEERHMFIEYMAEKLDNEMSGEQTSTSSVSTASELLRQTFGTEVGAEKEALVENLNAITEKVVENSFKATKSKAKNVTYRKVLEVAKMGSDFQKHPINVSSMATLFAIGLKYTTPRTLSDLTMGAILHDIGLSTLEPELIEKHMNLEELTDEEKSTVHMHPQNALNILKDMQIEPSPLTEQIILQHHERYDGKGYPRSLKGMMINELAFLVAFANLFDYRMNRQKDVKPIEIYLQIVSENDDSRCFPPALLRKLTAIMTGQPS